MEPIGRPIPEIKSQNDWYRPTFKVVDKTPEPKPKKKDGTLSKLREMLKPPVVRAHERLDQVEGRYYSRSPEGLIIETTINRISTADPFFEFKAPVGTQFVYGGTNMSWKPAVPVTDFTAKKTEKE